MKEVDNENINKILQLFENFDKDFILFVKKALQKATPEEILQFLSATSAKEILNLLKFDTLLAEHSKAQDAFIFGEFKGINKINFTKAEKARIELVLQLKKKNNGEKLTALAEYHMSEFRDALIDLNVEGGSVSEIIKTLNDKALYNPNTKSNFTRAQLGTELNTSFYDLSRKTTQAAFQDRPEQRFKYVGTLIPTSSDICIWLMTNQKPEGYTMDEITAGIETPFGMVNENGRVPNYNCGHQFVAIIE